MKHELKWLLFGLANMLLFSGFINAKTNTFKCPEKFEITKKCETPKDSNNYPPKESCIRAGYQPVFIVREVSKGSGKTVLKGVQSFTPQYEDIINKVVGKLIKAKLDRVKEVNLSSPKCIYSIIETATADEITKEIQGGQISLSVALRNDSDVANEETLEKCTINKKSQVFTCEDQS